MINPSNGPSGSEPEKKESPGIQEKPSGGPEATEMTKEFFEGLVKTLGDKLKPNNKNTTRQWIVSILVTIAIAAITSITAVMQLRNSQEQSQTYKDQIVPGLLSYLLEGRRFANEQLSDGKRFLDQLGISSSDSLGDEKLEELCSFSTIEDISFNSKLWKPTPVDNDEEDVQKFKDLLWSPMRGLLFERLLKAEIPKKCLDNILSKCQFKSAGFENMKLEVSLNLNTNLILDRAYILQSEWGKLKLPRVSMRNATIKDSKFYKMNLYGGDLRGTTIENSTFNRVDLIGVDFSGCRFEGDVIFQDCDTSMTIFQDTRGLAKFIYSD